MTNSNDFLKELAKEFGLECCQIDTSSGHKPNFIYYPNLYDFWLICNSGCKTNSVSIISFEDYRINDEYKVELIGGNFEDCCIWADTVIKTKLETLISRAKEILEEIKKKKINDKIEDLKKDFEN
jgi:hypothetical protein